MGDYFCITEEIAAGYHLILQVFEAGVGELHSNALVALHTTIGVAVLLEASVLGGLVVTTAAAAVITAADIGSPSSLRSSLVRVDLAMGELAGANALVRLTVLAEAVVLCEIS